MLSKWRETHLPSLILVLPLSTLTLLLEEGLRPRTLFGFLDRERSPRAFTEFPHCAIFTPAISLNPKVAWESQGKRHFIDV